MKKIVFLFIALLFSVQSLALNPYKGSYDLYAQTVMGNLKVGTAILNLEVNNNQFIYTTNAQTEAVWKALYDFTREEKSLGNEVDGQIINTYFSVIERNNGEVKKDYKISIATDKNYAVSSRGEEFEIKPGLLVAPLSVYLALSNDMNNKPSEEEFIYQVVDQTGVKYLKFKSLGAEKISINDIEFETIKVVCEDLQLTLNLSINKNFQPIKIHKINGKTAFTMVLIGFET